MSSFPYSSSQVKIETKKAYYEPRLRQNYGELTSAEAAILIDLWAKEDAELHEKLKIAYEQSLVVRTEAPKIESLEELGIFLNLFESKVRNTGYFPNSQWQDRARDVYRSDRNYYLNQEIIQQREILKQATSEIRNGCEKLQGEIAFHSSINLQQGCLSLISGSYSLLSLAAQYHYPKQSWFKKLLTKKLPPLNYARFRREERIQHIQYILDYLQQYIVTAEGNEPKLQLRRVESYLKALPLEVAYLSEWLAKEIARQHVTKLN